MPLLQSNKISPAGISGDMQFNNGSGGLGGGGPNWTGSTFSINGSLSTDSSGITTDGSGHITAKGLSFSSTIGVISFANGSYIAANGDGSMTINNGYHALDISTATLSGFSISQSIYFTNQNTGFYWDGGALLVENGSGGLVTNGGNTLDDGNGNLSIAGSISFQSATLLNMNGGEIDNAGTVDLAYLNVDGGGYVQMNGAPFYLGTGGYIQDDNNGGMNVGGGLNAHGQIFVNGGTGWNGSQAALSVVAYASVAADFEGEVDIGNGGFSDPSPGAAYDLKCGGLNGGMTASGAVNANGGYLVNNSTVIDSSGIIYASTGGIKFTNLSIQTTAFLGYSSATFTSLTSGGTINTKISTGTNTAGTSLTVSSGQGTGTGLGGSLIFQVAPAGTTGSTANALATALTIASTKAATFTSSVTTTQLVTGSITNNSSPLNFSASLIGLNSTSLFFDNYAYLSTNGTGSIAFTTSSAATTGSFTAWKITPTYNQTSGSAANTDFLINRTETHVGSGTQRLIDAQVGGTTKFNVDNAGDVSVIGTLTANGVSLLSNGIYSGTAPLVQIGDNGYGLSSHNSSLFYWATLSHVFNSTASAPQFQQTQQALTDATSIAWNISSGGNATVTLGGNRTLANPTNYVSGATYLVIVKQDGTGSRTLSYGTMYKWPASAAPTLSTAINAIDILTFYCDGTNLYGVAQKAFG